MVVNLLLEKESHLRLCLQDDSQDNERGEKGREAAQEEEGGTGEQVDSNATRGEGGEEVRVDGHVHLGGVVGGRERERETKEMKDWVDEKKGSHKLKSRGRKISRQAIKLVVNRSC